VKRRQLEKENARVGGAASKGKGLLREVDGLNIDFELKYGTKAFDMYKSLLKYSQTHEQCYAWKLDMGFFRGERLLNDK
jgi:hypothetical protein